MQSKAKGPTKQEKARWDAFWEIGCCCCRMDGGKYVPAQVHHLIDGGRRIGHAATIPLCVWHHVRTPPLGLSKLEATDYYGPSLAHGSKDFHRRYGSDQELLNYVNTLLASAGFKS